MKVAKCLEKQGNRLTIELGNKDKSSQGKKNKNRDKTSIFKVLSNTSLEAFPNNYYILKIETFQSQSSIDLSWMEN